MHKSISRSAKTKKLEQTAFDSSLNNNTRAEALFRLGQHYFLTDNHSVAFSYYSKGNDLMPHVNSDGRLAVPDWQKITQINKFFLANIPNWSYKKISQDVLCPAIIIAGLPRSGKTLTELLLSRLPGIVAGGELALIRKFFSRREAIDTSLDSLAQKLVEDNVYDLALQYQAMIERSTNPSMRIITDTTPTNIYKLGLFSLMYPNTPIIFCERNFLDLGISIYFKKFRRGHFYSYNQSTLGTTIAVVEALIDHWQQVLPNPILRIRYEDLVMHPRNTVDALVKFMQIPLTAIEIEQRFGDLFKSTNHQIFHPSLDANKIQNISPYMVGIGAHYQANFKAMKFSHAITSQLIK